MTPFAVWWAVAERRLRTVLRRGGLSPDDIDDVVQRTAERALVREFRDQKHMVGWCVVVGRRIAVDDWRSASRLQLVEDPSPAQTEDDPADIVVARLKRDGMIEAIGELSPFERDTLAGDLRADSRRASVRIAVERHRLRKRLRAHYETLGVAVASWRFRGSLRLGGVTESAAAAVAVGALAAVVATSAFGGNSPGTTLPRSERAETVKPESARAALRAVQSGTLASAVALVASGDRTREIRPEDYWRYEPPTTILIPMGRDEHGQPTGIGVREEEPDERGVLICSGYYADPDRKCMYYPQRVQRVRDAVKSMPR